MGLIENVQARVEEFQSFLQGEILSWKENQAPQGQSAEKPAGYRELLESMEYSLARGGKRFRPVLCMAVAEAFKVTTTRVLPFALAIELIHSYSLIHDDLPCMDNDDFRRGSPTNHRVFGEAIALLAGDGLLTEAFSTVAKSYSTQPALALQLIEIIGRASGFRGMIGGQAIDVVSGSEKVTMENLLSLHQRKTGALIQAATEGTAHLCELSPEKIEKLSHFGLKLGLAFQIKDDLLDQRDEKQGGKSFAELLGGLETKGYLKMVSEQALDLLTEMKVADSFLADLITLNLDRSF